MTNQLPLSFLLARVKEVDNKKKGDRVARCDNEANHLSPTKDPHRRNEDPVIPAHKSHARTVPLCDADRESKACCSKRAIKGKQPVNHEVNRWVP